MTRLFAFIIILSLSAGPSYLTAQIIFESGYIITNDLDTVRGWLGVLTFDKNLNECLFRRTEEGPVEEFAPGAIQAFYYDSHILFESKTVPESTENQRLAFAHTLVKGEYSLYKVADRYYSQKSNAEILLVPLNKEPRFPAEEVAVRREIAEYIQRLSMECPAIKEVLADLKKIKDERKIIEVFQVYNACRLSNYITYRQKVSVKFGLAFSANVFTGTFTHSDIIGRGFEEVRDVREKSLQGFQLGPELRLYWKSQPFQAKVGLQLEGHRLSTDQSLTFPGFPHLKNEVKLKGKQISLLLPLTFSYKLYSPRFPHFNISPFVSLIPRLVPHGKLTLQRDIYAIPFQQTEFKYERTINYTALQQWSPAYKIGVQLARTRKNKEVYSINLFYQLVPTKFDDLDFKFTYTQHALGLGTTLFWQ